MVVLGEDQKAWAGMGWELEEKRQGMEGQDKAFGLNPVAEPETLRRPC